MRDGQSSKLAVPQQQEPLTSRHNATSATVDSRFCCNICFDPVVEPVATLCGHLYCWPCLFRWLEPGMYPGERASLGMLQQPFASDTNRRLCPVCKAPCSVPTLVPIYVREEDFSDDPSPVQDQQEATRQSCGACDATVEIASQTSSNRDRVATEESGESSDTRSSYAANSSLHEEFANESITGLRQRIRFRSRDSENSTDSSTRVPSRPPAQSPRAMSPVSSSNPVTPQRYGGLLVAPLTPNAPHHRGSSLTHGLLLSIQQATAGTAGAVPPLHRRDGGHAADAMDAHQHSGATEYLSRLLLMFASFVILCLLLM